MSAEKQPEEGLDLDDKSLTRYDLVKEGLRRDDIEIVHYEPRYPPELSRVEKRVERTIAFLFVVSGLAALAFVAVYIFWPWEYEEGDYGELSKLYTPMLGLTLGVSLGALAIGLLTWAKKVLPVEEMVQERHDGASSPENRKLVGATLVNIADDTGYQRRPILKRALLFGTAPLGLAAIAPLGALIEDPKDDLFKTGFDPSFNEGRPVRLMLQGGELVRPEMISVGGQITVFPAIPDGTTNLHADSPTLLIHLRDEDAQTARDNAYEMYSDAQWNNFIAYSKICTHVGCPASLYEQQSNKLLCPCHQSQFQITDNAKPVFGPATRHLPQLPLGVDDEGYFYAKSDFLVPVGPAFWEYGHGPDKEADES